MTLEENFQEFCQNIMLDNIEDMKKTAGEIAKKLNKEYYDIENDNESHIYIVGSVGRETAIHGSSDLDIIFDLPNYIYKKYDSYESNGQSALIQEIKNVMLTRYPKTDIRGDGQVVVIEFNKYTVELVPGFKQTDDRFKYPDTHDNGSWKYTDPLSEQSECQNCNDESSDLYYDFCHIVRSWRNQVGFKMGGLLIDTLVYDFFQDNDCFSDTESISYLLILKDLYKYLKEQDKDRSYWYAVGSNQQVYNSDNGAFVSKAKKAYKLLEDIDESSEDINEILISLLGSDFPKAEDNIIENMNYISITKRDELGTNTEQFIDKLYPLDIRYELKIDCMVTQDGWRPFQLLNYLKSGSKYLRRNQKLDFYIVKTDCPYPYEISWKVRNVGEEAIKRKMIRGEIIKTDRNHQYEHTDFYGPHFVECYLVKNGVCVARDKIDVPIE